MQKLKNGKNAQRGPGGRMSSKKDTNWTLVPGSAHEIAAVRERCRQLVRRRAMLSAGVAAVPIPGRRDIRHRF